MNINQNNPLKAGTSDSTVGSIKAPCWLRDPDLKISPLIVLLATFSAARNREFRPRFRSRPQNARAAERLNRKPVNASWQTHRLQ
jgi:hypothetical protein